MSDSSRSASWFCGWLDRRVTKRSGFENVRFGQVPDENDGTRDRRHTDNGFKMDVQMKDLLEKLARMGVIVDSDKTGATGPIYLKLAEVARGDA